jgi:hypothetical protein
MAPGRNLRPSFGQDLPATARPLLSEAPKLAELLQDADVPVLLVDWFSSSIKPETGTSNSIQRSGSTGWSSSSSLIRTVASEKVVSVSVIGMAVFRPVQSSSQSPSRQEEAPDTGAEPGLRVPLWGNLAMGRETHHRKP